jgi:hypothetical protein
MMNVYLKGKNEKINEEELVFAARFMYRLLVSEYTHDRTNVWIYQEPLVHKYKLEGEVHVLDDYSIRNPKNFKIRLNNTASKRMQLHTLAHELVHVKQYTKNQLGYSWEEDDINYTNWRGKPVNIDKKCYWDLPWEVEAHGKEKGLYHRYKKFLQKHKMNFPR